MMSHLNYTNDVPPCQRYEEYGVYDTNSVSVPTSPIQYTVVSSFEVNGTTYYDYNVYDAPVLYYPVLDYAAEVYPGNYQYEENTSFDDVSEDNRVSQEYYSQYSLSYDDLISSDLTSTCAVSVNSYSESLCTSVTYHNSFDNSNSVNENSYTLEYNVPLTETSNSSYNCFPSLNENVEKNNQNISRLSTEVENLTAIKDEEAVLQIVNECHINTSASDTQADVTNYNASDVLQQNVEDSETNSDDDCEEHLLIHEENKVCDLNIEIDDAETKESDNVRYEECDNIIFTSDENKVVYWSVEVDDDDVNKVVDWSVEVDDDDENKVVDWSFEVDDDDEDKVVDWRVEVDDDDENKVVDWSVEVDDDDEKPDDHDDSMKVNLSSCDDIDLYNSKYVIKYLKEELYRYALSGHMSLKESIPVVDILPIINEESESMEEIDALEKAVDGLEYSDRDVLVSVVKKDEVADITFDVSQPFMKSYDLVSQVEDSEEITENLPDLVKMNTSSVTAFYIPQQEQSNSQHHLIQKDQAVDNEVNLSIKETEVLSFKKYSNLLSSGEEIEISVKNAKNLPQADNIINADLNITQMHQTKKGNMPKLQKDSIKMIEEPEAIEIKSFCQNDRTLLKSGEEEGIRKELLSKKVDSNRNTNAISHVPQKTEHDGECHTKGYVEKIVKSEEKVSSKTKKKKFHNLRKWIGNMCCWMKKKT